MRSFAIPIFSKVAAGIKKILENESKTLQKMGKILLFIRYSILRAHDTIKKAGYI